MTATTPTKPASAQGTVAGWQPWETVPRDDDGVLAMCGTFRQVVFWDTAENTGWHVSDSDIRYPEGAFTHWRRDWLAAAPEPAASPAGGTSASVEAVTRIIAREMMQSRQHDNGTRAEMVARAVLASLATPETESRDGD